MDKRNLNRITWGFVAGTVLVVLLMLFNTLHRPEHIVLPDTSAPQGQTEAPGRNSLTVVEVTPETVQTVIATLARPEAYRRTVTTELFWNSGSGACETATAVLNGWTRVDRVMPDGRVRHSILGPEGAYVWYQGERDLYRSGTDVVSADHEQFIPTYEDLLEVPKETITAADYRTYEGLRCIYAEVSSGQEQQCYWVSVDTGLLVAAEKLLDGERIYRMESLTVDETEPDVTEFTLPDGTVLAR